MDLSDILKVIYGAGIGWFLALTPIPVVPYIMFIAFFRWVRMGKWWAVPLTLAGGIGLIALPFVIMSGMYINFGLYPTLALVIVMYFPYWWPYKAVEGELGNEIDKQS